MATFHPLPPVLHFLPRFPSRSLSTRPLIRVSRPLRSITCATSSPSPSSPSPSRPRSLAPALRVPPKPVAGLRRHLQPLWAFCRPHTLIGTVCSVVSISLLVFFEQRLSLAAGLLGPGFRTALAGACLVNIYIVGLNQLCDLPIDRVNKPWLPLAAGSMGTATGTRIVLASLLLATWLGWRGPGTSGALRAVLGGSTLLGTLYSLPPVRLKRFPFLASAAILSVRGLLANLGFYLHALGSAGLPGALSPVARFAAAFFALFGVVIALMKDVPDVKGDWMFGIRSFSVTLGPARVLAICIACLAAMYALAALFFALSAGRPLLRGLLALSHLLVGNSIIGRARQVDPAAPGEVYGLYAYLWKLFYLEYLLIPLAAL